MKIYIGGAWPYANNSLHIGHLAALLPGDVIARYYRLKGDEVIYVSGTDAHGTPITLRAKEENKTPKQIARFYHEEFANNFKALDFSYDLYGVTYDEFHKEKVQEYFLQIKKNGYIYEKEAEQDYCTHCEQFLSDREIIGVCPSCGGLAKGDQCETCLVTFNAGDIKNKKCKHCAQSTTLKENTHLYFALSKFQRQIEALVKQSQDKWRLNAVNETIKYLDEGLIDRAATREISWGVDVPVAGFENKKIYVWIEAVLGYLTAAEKYAFKKGIDFNAFMRDAKDLRTYYVHGKDNIPFHTIIYPSLLMAINNGFKLPDYIISSEYINVLDEKMSKSTGNLVPINDLLTKYNSDTIRYYTIFNGPEKRDINFSFEELETLHNKHLVGGYGNFVNRNLAFLVKKFNGVVPTGTMDQSIDKMIDNTYIEVGRLIEKGDLKAALNILMNFVQSANKYYDDQKPWLQVKESLLDFNNTTFTCINIMANMANLFSPFMPKSSATLKEMLGITEVGWQKVQVKLNLKLSNVDILFERIESTR